MKVNNVYVGNNLDILKTFPDNSIDSVVTDPPYGLGKEPNAVDVLSDWVKKGYHEVKGKGFMGKEWDAFVPQPNFWKEIYRVLKPGGYVLSFAGTRTYDWMVMAVRLAGFEIRDMIAWLYGSGFPKSLDISKAIDKSMGAKREVVGKHQQPAKSIYTQAQVEMSKDVNITAPSTEEAKQWQGWGTSLKPALEPIVMARKPLAGTVAQNVLKHGVGGINIDECRVDFENGENTLRPLGKSAYQKGSGMVNGGIAGTHEVKFEIGGNSDKGRFPANVIHDGSEEVVSLFPESKAGEYKGEGTKSGGIWSESTGQPAGREYGDSGSASRFFYTAKASKEERNFGLYDFEKDVVTDGRTKPIDNAFNRGKTKRKNTHPTVKPIDLMRYLVRLVTPKNGICLDPYLGSGTTAIACEMEKFSWIGIELMPEYAEIAKARIGAVKDYEATLDTKTIIKESIKEDKEKEAGIMNIFDFMEEKNEQR